MRKKPARRVLAAALAVFVLATPAYGGVNKSVHIEDGGMSDGASSVNGSVTVGDNATVSGSLKTVNGAIRVGVGSSIEDAGTVNGSLRIANMVKAEDLETVNGAIKIGEDVVIDGEVSTVNGQIDLRDRSSVARDLSNVNGSISLNASQVGGDVSTVNGDVRVMEGAVIKGDLIMEKPRGLNWGRRNDRRPKVVIGPGSRIEGVIRLEREVKLYVSTTAEIGGVEGEMSMDDAERFSGNRP
jgi:hypothetical protein